MTEPRLARGPLRRLLLAGLCLAGTATSSRAQSLWTTRGSAERGLISDHVAGAIGDIVLVVVEERQSVKDDGKVELSKEVTLDAAIEVFDIAPNAFDTLPAVKYGNTRTFDGEAKYAQEGSFQTVISAVVIDVKPNGNLLIEGRRTLRLDGEFKAMHVRGMVRPVDIDSDNMVSSAKVANGDVFYDTEGERSDSTSKGWWEILMDIFWPF